MPEIDEAGDDACEAAVSQDGLPASEGGDSLPRGDLGLEVLEGLARKTERRSTTAHDSVATAARSPCTRARLPPPAAGPSLLDSLAVSCGERPGRRIDALQIDIRARASREASRERIVDRLHAELQDYKQDFLLEDPAADLHRPDSASR